MYFISKNFWFTIHVDSWFWRIIDQICWACAIFCSIPNLQARTDGRMDRQMDELIRVGLGNLRFLQVKRVIMCVRGSISPCWSDKVPYEGPMSHVLRGPFRDPIILIKKSKQSLESEMLWGSIRLLGTLIALVFLAEIFWSDRRLVWWWNLGLADL